MAQAGIAPATNGDICYLICATRLSLNQREHKDNFPYNKK